LVGGLIHAFIQDLLALLLKHHLVLVPILCQRLVDLINWHFIDKLLRNLLTRAGGLERTHKSGRRHSHRPEIHLLGLYEVVRIVVRVVQGDRQRALRSDFLLEVDAVTANGLTALQALHTNARRYNAHVLHLTHIVSVVEGEHVLGLSLPFGLQRLLAHSYITL